MTGWPKDFADGFYTTMECNETLIAVMSCEKKAHEPKARWFSGSQWVSFCWGLKTHWTYLEPLKSHELKCSFAIFSHIWSMWTSHVGLSCRKTTGRNPSFFATHPLDISKNRQLRQAWPRLDAGRVEGATDVLHRGLRVLRRALDLCGELHRQRRRCRSEEPLGRAGRQCPGVGMGWQWRLLMQKNRDVVILCEFWWWLNGIWMITDDNWWQMNDDLMINGWSGDLHMGWEWMWWMFNDDMVLAGISPRIWDQVIRVITLNLVVSQRSWDVS